MFDPISTAAGAAIGVGDAFLGQRFAQENMHSAQDFSMEMYDTRYQRQVADMKAAGLNPMLSYMTGAPSGPSGSPTSGAKPDISGSINQTRLASAQEANIQADTEKKKTEADNILTDTFVKSNMPAKIQAETRQALQSADTAAALQDVYHEQIGKIEQEISTLQTQSEKNKADTTLAKKLADSQQYLNALRTAEAMLASASKSLKYQEYDINAPKVRAAGAWSAEAGERGKNMWNLFSPFK